MRAAGRAQPMRCFRSGSPGCSGSRSGGWRWSAVLRCGPRRSRIAQALLAFGSDRLVEMLSASVVLLEFHP